VPNVAPIKLATLKTEAAIVPDNIGASVAARIIFEFKIGVVPNVPAPNKKLIIGARIVIWSENVNSAKTIARTPNVTISCSVKRFSGIFPERKLPMTAPSPKVNSVTVTPVMPKPANVRIIGSINVYAVNTPENPKMIMAMTRSTFLF